MNISRDATSNIVWSEPRQMWDGRWYRVGSSTGANLDVSLVPSAAAVAYRDEIIEEYKQKDGTFNPVSWLKALDAHWNEFGPDHGFEELLYQAIRALKERAAPQDKQCGVGDEPLDQAGPAVAAPVTPSTAAVAFGETPLPEYTAEKLHENFPNRIDATLLSGPYTPIYLARQRIDQLERELNALRSPLRRTYDEVADAVNEVAEAAAQAFRLAGFEPGEWDNDNIVKDVSNGIAADIARMGDLIRDLRAHIAQSATARVCPYCTSDNPAIRSTYYDQTCEGCVKRMGKS